MFSASVFQNVQTSWDYTLQINAPQESDADDDYRSLVGNFPTTAHQNKRRVDKLKDTDRSSRLCGLQDLAPRRRRRMQARANPAAHATSSSSRAYTTYARQPGPHASSTTLHHVHKLAFKSNSAPRKRVREMIHHQPVEQTIFSWSHASRAPQDWLGLGL